MPEGNFKQSFYAILTLDIAILNTFCASSPDPAELSPHKKAQSSSSIGPYDKINALSHDVASLGIRCAKRPQLITLALDVHGNVVISY